VTFFRETLTRSMHSSRIVFARRGFCAFFVACVVSAADPARAQQASELDREFQFASKLVEYGFADYAQKLADGILARYPDQAARVNLIKAEGMIRARKFQDAEALLKSMGKDPKADAIRLALANGYYAIGEVDKAKQIYNDFFKQYTATPTDPDLLKFYRDSAYTYGKLLERAGDLLGAAQSYNRIIMTKPERDIERNLMAERAQIFVKLTGADRDKYLKEASKICEQIQWGGVDIPFGQSIIAMANIELVKGSKAKAKETLKNYDDIFKQIDDLLQAANRPLSLSPKAGARFLLGQMYQQEGDALAKDPAKKDDAIKTLVAALTEYYNVFVKYGDSDWGPEAGARVKAIETQLKAMGKEIKVDLGAQKEKAITTQFNLADNLFVQKKYKEAIVEYLKSLNAFPESDVSVRALGNLVRAYAELGDDRMARVVAAYLAERFTASEQAANSLLVLGKYYFDKKDSDMYTYVYELFLAGFPSNSRAAGILFTLAGVKKKEGDAAKAAEYFSRIIRDYKSDQYYPKALSQLAWGSYQDGEYAKAIEGFRIFVAESRPGPEQVLAQFSLGDCYVKLGQFVEAAAEFEKLIAWLAPKENAYSSNAADAEKNRQVLEKAVFQRATCYAKVKEPADKVADFRDKATRGFEQFVGIFPQSPLAPKALMGKGRIQLELKQYDAASKTFDELAAKYPQSDEGKNALASLATSAMEIKQYDQARQAFAKMLKDPTKFGADEFVLIGQAMVDAEMFAEAVKAFEQAQKMSQDRAVLERALFGLGRGYYANKQYDQAIASIEDLLTRYPKSALFFDAKYLLGQAYRDANKLSEAQNALRDIYTYSTNNVLINRANLTLGDIQRRGGDLQGALGSYQRIALLADPTKPDLKPLIHEAILQAIAVAGEMGRYQDVQDSCDQYLKLFSTSDKVEEIRRIKADAKLKASQSLAGTGAANTSAAP
jgi:TolA-binding protein